MRSSKSTSGTELITDLLDEPETLRDALAGTDYHAVNVLGRGGMGTVYCAQHKNLGHMVAVKVLHLSGSNTLQATDRGRLEGQVGARLRHPNLVAVHDLGTTAHGLPFIAMERVRGETLFELLDDAGGGPLPLAQSLDIICQALSGLQAVHEAGLVHRDITPANIFVCNDGTVKVLDLGCAKVIEYATALTPQSLVIPTAADAFIGSPRYMAPEQAAAKPVDGRADIYATACVLYRLLCGRGPFDGARCFAELREAHLTKTPPPPSSHLRTPLPKGLDELLLQCLAKDPAARPSSAAELAAVLRRIELEARDSEQFGDSYVTEPMCPPTTMGESHMWEQPPPAPTQGGVTLKQLVLIIIACLLVGVLLGGAAVAMGVGQ